ncbi:MAG: hypothetical protein ACQETI_01000 [Halobacteriota archaeon]
MINCTRPGCRWQAIAPSVEAAQQQYAEHLASEHTSDVEVQIPDGMVQVRLDEDDDGWVTVSIEEAQELYDEFHRLRDDD